MDYNHGDENGLLSSDEVTEAYVEAMFKHNKPCIDPWDEEDTDNDNADV